MLKHTGMGKHYLTLTEIEPVSLLRERSADRFMLRSILSEAELLPESESLLDQLPKKREVELMLPLCISSAERRSYWLFLGLWLLGVTEMWSLFPSWLWFAAAEWPLLSTSISGLMLIMSGFGSSTLWILCTWIFSEELLLSALLLIVLSGLWSFKCSARGFIPLLTGRLSFSTSEEYGPFFAGG